MGDGLLSPILQWATTCDHVRVAQGWCAQNDQAIWSWIGQNAQANLAMRVTPALAEFGMGIWHDHIPKDWHTNLLFIIILTTILEQKFLRRFKKDNFIHY